YGGVNKVTDVTDVLMSTDPCLTWICMGWTPVIDVHEGWPCITSIGVKGVCNAEGVCIQCLVDTDCPTWGDHCSGGTCVSCEDNKKDGDETSPAWAAAVDACLIPVLLVVLTAHASTAGAMRTTSRTGMRQASTAAAHAGHVSARLAR